MFECLGIHGRVKIIASNFWANGAPSKSKDSSESDVLATKRDIPRRMEIRLRYRVRS